MDGHPSFAPTASWERLRNRASLLREVRSFFDSRSFIEVETPVLCSETVVDRHLDPIAVSCGDRTMWLQTSPELCMKRLMACGGESIYQITKAFRAGESGRLHNPEFTMLEWYRVGDTMDDAIDLLDEFAQATLGREPAERLSYADAFVRYAAVDPRCADPDALIRAARTADIPIPREMPDDRDAWLELLLVSCVERQLGHDRPVVLFDYPASQAALARVRDEAWPVAERFELYVDGIELANGYHELLDAAELLARTAENNSFRQRDGRPRLPVPARFVGAMEHGLPACSGVALGFDRLSMLASGATDVASVMTFPGGQ